MSDDDVKQRLTELQGQRQTRAKHADEAPRRVRPDLRGLMVAAPNSVAEEPGRSPAKWGAIAQLAKNPEIRRALLQWLQQQESHAMPQSGGGENAWGLEFGVEGLPRSEELSTSSTLEEITRYYHQLENRADWLEAALQETLLEMQRVNRFKLAASETSKPEEPLTPPTDPAI